VYFPTGKGFIVLQVMPADRVAVEQVAGRRREEQHMNFERLPCSTSEPLPTVEKATRDS